MLQPIKARKAGVRILEESSAEGLQAALEAWFRDAGEAELVDLHFKVSGDRYVALILYVL